MRKAADFSCTLMLWWKQRLCTCQAALNLSPWRHLPYPVTGAKERKLVRDTMGKKKRAQGETLLVSALSTAQSWGCAKHVGKNRAISQLTELGLFHGQLWWLPRACRYTQLVSLGCFVFLAQFPEEMRLMRSCWVCVGVGTWACVSLSLQASPLEILNPLVAFNPIWQNTGDINFQQVQWNG